MYCVYFQRVIYGKLRVHASADPDEPCLFDNIWFCCQRICCEQSFSINRPKHLDPTLFVAFLLSTPVSKGSVSCLTLIQTTCLSSAIYLFHFGWFPTGPASVGSLFLKCQPCQVPPRRHIFCHQVNISPWAAEGLKSLQPQLPTLPFHQTVHVQLQTKHCLFNNSLLWWLKKKGVTPVWINDKLRRASTQTVYSLCNWLIKPPVCSGTARP